MRLFSAYSANNQRDLQQEALGCRIQEARGLIILARSWHKLWSILLG